MKSLKQTRAASKVPKLRRLLARGLSRIDREAFLLLVWGLWGLQRNPPIARARTLIDHPPEAVGAAFGSVWAIHPWELETLLNQLFRSTPDRTRQPLRNLDFGLAPPLVNALRKLENTEAGAYLDSDLIFSEMHRIGQRQFPWQRNIVNPAELYRNLFLYGQGLCAEFFERHHAVSISDFMKTGIVLYATLSQEPAVSGVLEAGVLGLDMTAGRRAAAMMTLPIGDARAALVDLSSKLSAERFPTAFQPSLMRQSPVLALSEGHLCAPLPPLIMQRITAGLYYDLLPGGGAVRNAIARHFEDYCRRLLAAVWPQLTVAPEHRYPRSPGRAPVDSPDVLISDQDDLVLVIECKSTKLTFPAQFADDPVVAAADKYDELAKGVFQLWRYFAHCRLGLTGDTLTPKTLGLVVTADGWLMLSHSIQDRVMALAREKAAADPDIALVDRRPITFVSIQDLERVLLRTDAAGFLRTVAEAADNEKFSGWMLADVGRELGETAQGALAYPFSVSELLPWWTEFETADGA